MRRRLWLASTATALACVSVSALVASCGFELRRAPSLGFRSVALKGFEPRSPLAEELKRSLQESTRVVEPPVVPEAVLTALTDRREKSVVASTAAGQVREVQLRVKFGFRLATPSGRELLKVEELLASRDMSYSETAALAKEQEEAELYRAMEADLVGQVLRRLAALPPV